MFFFKKKLPKILLIGWDAADWIIIDPLIASGKMPNLQKLIGKGIRSNLKTLEPKLSPILWTTIATGKTADKHGILNFVEPKPDGDGLRISQSTSRKTKAVWNILSQSGIKTNVIGWYASHPAEPINGAVVSNLLFEDFIESGTELNPLTDKVVHPENIKSVISNARVHYSQFPEVLLHQLLPKHKELSRADKHIDSIKKKMGYALSIEQAAVQAMKMQSWNATFVFFDAIDTMGHQFMQYRKPRMSHVSEKELNLFGDVMDAVYEWHDQSLGRLLAAAGDDINVIIISDHGFHSGDMRPNLESLPPERRMELESSWHRPFGVLCAAGPDINKGVQMAPSTLLDITPTILHLFDLSVGKDMDGRVLLEMIKHKSKLKIIDTWDKVVGEDGMHPEDMRSDPIENTASINQLIDLGYLAALPKNKKDQIDLVERESIFNLALALKSLHKNEKAIELFEQLLIKQPDQVRYTICLAQSLMALMRYEETIVLLEKAIKKHQQNTDCLAMLCLAYSELNRNEDAVAIIQKLEIIFKNKLEFTFTLASLTYAQHRFDAALQYAKKAQKANPQDPNTHVMMARIALATGNFEACIEYCLDALDITQAIADAHFLLGAALAWLGDFVNALKSFDTCLLIDDEHYEALQFACHLAVLSQKKEQEKSYKSKALAIQFFIDNKNKKEFPFGLTDFAVKHKM
jgi:predicted AlkP superfamily phosphohydrolase/phosphomutase/tetratricopeptide (TPR) repeat protein